MPVKQGQAGVKQEMHKFKAGELHSGSKKGPVVTDRKQAIAIAMNQAGLSKDQKKSAHGSGPFSDAEIKQGYKSLGKFNPATAPTGPTTDTVHKGYRTAGGGAPETN